MTGRTEYIGLRLTADELATLDRRRGTESRSTWLRARITDDTPTPDTVLTSIADVLDPDPPAATEPTHRHHFIETGETRPMVKGRLTLHEKERACVCGATKWE